ncbi:MAG: hypothetical protein LBJ95_04850 [Oscillospiraceae bacterium]|jgi:hypothetical protein|nr:hypothetical protein [Oscillospiraceae bacterium]
MANKEETNGFVSFKFKDVPLVRCGKSIYYGDISEPYVIKMDIKSETKVQDLDIADRVSVQLMCTDQDVSAKKRIIKATEKSGLYLAIDIAEAWLNRMRSV